MFSTQELRSLSYMGCRLCGGSAAGEQRKALLMIIADVAGNQAAIQSLTKQLVSKNISACILCLHKSH